ncbi:hypothetical protein WN48_00003 [Eufriesea mexicana]|uniref:Uncharacterized protein n=1 Tax=Eufriesea mexicana TaxID=516756 RepID=A0A310S3T0_9HYME|nr:hypothetical protein WN48_00003 [Eufriesea mexicana]
MWEFIFDLGQPQYGIDNLILPSWPNLRRGLQAASTSKRDILTKGSNGKALFTGNAGDQLQSWTRRFLAVHPSVAWVDLARVVVRVYIGGEWPL